MAKLSLFATVLFFFCSLPMHLLSSQDGLPYDPYAYTECKAQAELPLYNGGLLQDQHPTYQFLLRDDGVVVNASSFQLKNLYLATKYTFSIWVKTNDEEAALVRGRLVTDTKEESPITACIGSVLARKGCWSFLKGGFVLHNAPSNSSTIYIHPHVNKDRRDVTIEVSSASLQPFTDEQWRLDQDLRINKTRRRAATIHVVDRNGTALQGAAVRVELASRDFPFGAAISDTIIGNSRAQKWFVERFNAAVFEDQLKWYATEPTQGHVNYSVPDKMLAFTRSNQITVRGHNVVWTAFGPIWTKNLTGAALQSAVDSRIESLMNKYKGEFIHWDVNNEMLHNAFYEERLGPNATLQIYKKVQQADPLAGLFMNEYNVVEGCTDEKSTVDTYIAKIKELQGEGISRQGIGLQSHFGLPNPPLMRAVLDKFATLDLPIWLTEVDISHMDNKQIQAMYLEEVLREGYSHPAVDGIMLWTALNNDSCYKMCLTDNDYNNLATGNTVDKLLEEWNTEVSQGQTDERGAYTFVASLGQYRLSVNYGEETLQTTLSVPGSKDSQHFNIQI